MSKEKKSADKPLTKEEKQQLRQQKKEEKKQERLEDKKAEDVRVLSVCFSNNDNFVTCTVIDRNGKFIKFHLNIKKELI